MKKAWISPARLELPFMRACKRADAAASGTFKRDHITEPLWMCPNLIIALNGPWSPEGLQCSAVWLGLSADGFVSNDF